MVRKDLPPSNQAVQACHAALEIGRNSISAHVEHPHLVLLGVENEKELRSVIQKLVQHEIEHRAFIEPDLGHQLTAIATVPLSGRQRKFFQQFPLLKLGHSKEKS